MDKLAEQRILEQADEIRQKNARVEKAAEEATQVKAMKKLIGKYYLDWTGGFADTDGVDAYRVLSEGFHDNYVYVEHWMYAHDEHYAVEHISWYEAPTSENMKEVTKIEFMQEISKWFKKVGLYEIFNEETDH